MTSTSYRTAVVAVTIGIGAGAQPARAQDTLTRIRPMGAVLTSVVQDAMTRSSTFRQLAATINTSDGIIYVAEGDCGGRAQACLVSVTDAGRERILHVHVSTRRSRVDLIAYIGHELQHAIEVLSVPGIRSTAAMYFFYRRESRTTGLFETTAAMRTGEAVRDEVRQSMRAAPVP